MGCATTPVAPTESSSQPDDQSQIRVVSLATQPRKEAMVVYRGRVYAVRPGDKIEGLTVIDITDSGVRVGRQ